MNKVSSIALALILALPTFIGSARAQLQPDEMTTKPLPDLDSKSVFVLDAGFPSSVVAKLDIIDGNTRKMLGQLSGGYLSNFEISPDHREMYMIDTYYSRAWRGTRTDVVTVFDAKTLNWLAEIEIPAKRILIVPKRDTTAITPDGRFLLVSNMTPATSVSVVDVKARKFVGEIDTPGCVQTIAPANRQFSSMCADGSMMTVTFDDNGALKDKKQGKPYFDPNADPVFDQPAVVGTKAYFDSYHGAIHVLDLSGAEAMAEPEWSVLGEGDSGWRPGGWQTIAANEKKGLVFVLMHQGGEWTHKQFGNEIWVFDAAKKTRVSRIQLKTPAYSIYVSQDDDPIVYALALKEARLEEYSASDGKFLGDIDQLGTPYLIYGP